MLQQIGQYFSGGTVECNFDKFVSEQISGNSFTEQITDIDDA